MDDAETAPGPAAAPAAPESAARLTRLPWRAYPLRTLGMGLGGLPAAMVLLERGSGGVAWAWMAFGCFLWPHLAFLHARRSRDPFRAELRNFVGDSMLAASLVPVMQFNLLPSAMLLIVVLADKINSGVRGLWLRSLPAMAVALLLAGAICGWEVAYESSTPVVLACLPMLAIHTLAVSASTYRLVRKVQRQNLQLDALTRRDPLTGLESRAHWQAQAELLLRRHQQDGVPATLVMLDLDHFKPVNDRYGHGVGDEVLRAVADRLRPLLGASGHAGRLGGDEFAIALQLDHRGAESFAEALRDAVASIDLPQAPALRCSVSLGLADPPPPGQGLREWLESADRALYRAKHEGRNRLVRHA